MIKEVKSFTIDRSQWGNGEVIKAAHKTFGGDDESAFNGSDNSYLRREDGLCCCLGLYAKACGFKDESINGLELPAEGSDKLCQLYDDWSEEDIKSAATVNDDDGLGSKYREKTIKSIFKKYGITVKFKGKISEAIRTMKDYWK